MRNFPRLLGLPSGTTSKPTYLVRDIEPTANDDEPAPTPAPVGQSVSAGKQKAKALPVPNIEVIDLTLSDDDEKDRLSEIMRAIIAPFKQASAALYVRSAGIANPSRHYNLRLYARNGLKWACGTLNQVILRPDAGLHRFKTPAEFVNPDTRARKERRREDGCSLMRGR